VVLIDRNHKKFPIKVDYKGISVSTSIADHIELIFEKNNIHALIK
jgi:pyrimidine operon attenuation protein/uracil phosphoribosyltransferase